MVFCINIECHFNASFISIVCRVGFGLAHFLICGDSSLEGLSLVKTVLKKFCQFCFLSLILFKEEVFNISFLLLSQGSSNVDSSKDSIINV